MLPILPRDLVSYVFQFLPRYFQNILFFQYDDICYLNDALYEVKKKFSLIESIKLKENPTMHHTIYELTCIEDSSTTKLLNNYININTLRNLFGISKHKVTIGYYGLTKSYFEFKKTGKKRIIKDIIEDVDYF